MTDVTIDFTPDMLVRLKARYQQAIDDDEDVFEFDGNEWVRGYAKYVIEYLEGEFNDKR